MGEVVPEEGGGRLPLLQVGVADPKVVVDFPVGGGAPTLSLPTNILYILALYFYLPTRIYSSVSIYLSTYLFIRKHLSIYLSVHL